MSLVFLRRLISLMAGTYVLLVLVVVFAAFWTNYRRTDGVALPNGELVGGDFICFYDAGGHARAGVDALYDFEKANARQKQLIGARTVHSGLLPFAYPPLVALLFYPLSYLSFLHAYLVWLIVSIVLAVLAILLVLRWIPFSKPAKIACLLVAFAFVPFSINCLGGGQTSCLGLLLYALVFYFLKAKKELIAGIALSLSYYKPPLFLVFLIFILLHRRWKMFAGFLIGALGLIAGSIAMVGMKGLAIYLQRVSNYTYGHELLPGVTLPPERGVGLYAQLVTMLSASPFAAKLIFAVVSLILVFGTYWLAIRGRQWQPQTRYFDLLFSLEVVLSTLLSLQLLYYDLTILLVPIIIVASRMLAPDINYFKLPSVAAIAGLFTEFLYRESLSTRTSLKAAPLFLEIWIAGLVVWIFNSRRGLSPPVPSSATNK